MNWEYTTLMMGTSGILGGLVDGDHLTSRLNELGAEGRELLSTFDPNQMQGRTRDVIAILKRPLAASTDAPALRRLR